MGYIDLSSSIGLEDISLSDFINLGDAEVEVEADDVHNLDTWIET